MANSHSACFRSTAQCAECFPTTGTQRSVVARVTAVQESACLDTIRIIRDQRIAETDHLHAILCGLNLPILHICPDLTLHFYSDAAARLFDLRETNLGTRPDYGRPLSDMGDVASVCRTGLARSPTATGADGQPWTCHILPHFTRSGAPGGATVYLIAVATDASADPADVQQMQFAIGLTARQRQIMALVLAGQPSKNIAADLNISQRTVENHRAAIMRRTGATSLPALARLAVGASGRADCRVAGVIRQPQSALV